MFKVRFFTFLITLCISLQVSALTKEVEVDSLSPTQAHERATDLITHFISNYHYRKTPLDNDLSASILKRYLETLDPGKAYFLQEDIKKFSQYKYTLDESLRASDLTPAYEIFKTYRKRVDQRVNFALAQLEKAPDFSIDENYNLERKEAAWATGDDQLDEFWRKRLKNDVLSLRLSDKKPEEIHDLLKKRYESLKRNTHQINAEDVFQFFMNAYTTSIEPHTSYFSPRTSENFDIQMKLSLEGIGAVLQSDDEYTVVKEIIVGGPASLDKTLQPEDKIVGVGQGKDGEIVDVIGWRLDDVVDLIRGPKDSFVRLELIPKAAGVSDARKAISLKRDKINLEEQAAKGYIIELPSEDNHASKKIGVIDLPTFYLDFAALARGEKDFRSSTRDVKRLIDELSQHKIDGLMIDLRSNGGGSLLEATSLTGLFIETGPVVQVKDALGRLEVNDDTDPSIAYAGPLAVMVDRYSASASEIFAGAIQDYRRGIILGEPTFGKGTVQNLIDLNQYDDRSDKELGHLKTTIAQFFRVNGKSTQHRGVVPDIIFPTSSDDDSYGERAYDNALPWASVNAATFTPALAPVKEFDAARWQHEARIAKDPAFTLLMEEIKSVRELQDRDSISLNEAQRRKERDSLDELSKTRDEKYKALSKSMPEFVQLEEEPKAAKKTETEEEEDVARDDILLIEGARVLRDLIDARKQAIEQPTIVNLNNAEQPLSKN